MSFCKVKKFFSKFLQFFFLQGPHHIEFTFAYDTTLIDQNMAFLSPSQVMSPQRSPRDRVRYQKQKFRNTILYPTSLRGDTKKCKILKSSAQRFLRNRVKISSSELSSLAIPSLMAPRTSVNHSVLKKTQPTFKNPSDETFCSGNKHAKTLVHNSFEQWDP